MINSGFDKKILDKPFFPYSEEEVNAHEHFVYIWKSFGENSFHCSSVLQRVRRSSKTLLLLGSSFDEIGDFDDIMTDDDDDDSDDDGTQHPCLHPVRNSITFLGQIKRT